MPQLFIIPVLVQINTGPASEKRQSTINRPKAAVVLELLKGLLLSTPKNRTKQREELDTLRVTAILGLRKLPNLSNILSDHGRTVPCHEDGFSVLGCKGLASLGCPSLHDHRCALRTGLTKVRTWHVEVLSLMVDLSHACWICVDSALAIENHCVLPPG